jgi:hypothetical protein
MFDSRPVATAPMRRAAAVLLALAASLVAPGAALAQRAAPPIAAQPAPPLASYADFAALTEQASVVAIVEVRDQAVVEPARAPGLAPGHARLYLEGRTQALLAGGAALGESVVYLADVPLTAKGKAPKLRKQRFIVFADPATPETEQLARTVIAALAAPDAPPALTGVRDVMSVAGNLTGESETQLFLETATGTPVSLTVIRRPGMNPQWGVSWSEIVDQAARPPAPETVEWYRLACFLPPRLPRDAFLQDDRAAHTRAEADYAFILEQLGGCPRIRT